MVYICVVLRLLTNLMICVSSLASRRLRDALFSRVEDLLDTSDPSLVNSATRVLHFLYDSDIRPRPWPLQEKCSQILLQNVHQLPAEKVCQITWLHEPKMNNFDLKLAVELRLLELIDSSTDPSSFTKLFVTLSPLASAETRKEFVLFFYSVALYCTQLLTT